jgi:tripartite ATP-independent transporter DctP family solute receptor
MTIRTKVGTWVIGAAVLLGASIAAAQEPIKLIGSSPYGDDHSFTKALLKFEELVHQYYGKPVEFVIHRNNALGADQDIINLMTQGISVDFAHLSPSNMAGYVPEAPAIDLPFLFRDTDHWNRAIDAGLLDSVGKDVAEKADLMWIGYGGGGVRNINSTKQLTSLEELKGLRIRVQGAPIWSLALTAVGMAPTVIAYDEVYGALQNGVIDAHENAIAAINQRRHYEVAPFLLLTQHAIETRPLAFSGKTFRRLPPELQDAILRAGKESSAYGRELEIAGAKQLTEELAKSGKLTVTEFTETEELRRLAEPAIEAYAAEIGATELVKSIRDLP